MDSNFPDEHTLRQYLLGRLDDQEKLENSLSLQILTEDVLSETVDVIEDEIIEDYLDGSLKADENKAVEEYFLRSPERREKLEFARLVRSHLETKPSPTPADGGNLIDPGSGLIASGSSVAVMSHWRLHLRTYCEIAFLFLSITSFLMYVSVVRHRMQSVQNELDQERIHSEHLSGLATRPNAPSVRLDLFSRSLLGAPDKKKIKIEPTTKYLSVIATPHQDQSGAYDASLGPKGGKITWFLANIRVSGNMLTFEIPAEAVKRGANCLVITQSQPNPGNSETTCFEVE